MMSVPPRCCSLQQVNRWHMGAVEAAGSDSNRLRNVNVNRSVGTKDFAAAGFLNLGTILLEFLQLYGKNMRFEEVGISLRNGGTYFQRSSRYDRGQRAMLCCVLDRRRLGSGCSTSISACEQLGIYLIPFAGHAVIALLLLCL